jgi:hypothetical protein
VFLKDLECFFRWKDVLQVAHIKQIDNLPWSEIKKKTPQRKPTCLGPKVEARVGERSQRQMHNTFVGSKPAELRVLGKLTRNRSEIRHQFFDLAPDEAGTEHCGSLAN